MEKYTCTAETATNTVAKYGVAIIPYLLDADDCATLLSKMWTFFEEKTSELEPEAKRVRRTDCNTWPTLLDLMPSHGMLFQHWGIGHADFAWWLRQHPKVVKVFSEIWKTKPEDLLVSFDGASFQAPPDRDTNPHPKRGWGSKKEWFHSDQSLKRPQTECFQAWVTALNVEEADATLCVLEGSHIYHAELAKAFPKLVFSEDWVKYTPEAVKFLEAKGCKRVRIACPPGSLVLWDSRTAHYGAPPIAGRAEPKFRAVVYVCYTPRYLAKKADLARKRSHFKALRTCSHWPHKSKMFGLKPRTFGKPALPPLKKSVPPQLSKLGRRLAGFD